LEERHYRVYVMMRLVDSPVVRALGYLPGWLGPGEDLPKGVFLEWTNWVMKPRYVFEDPIGKFSPILRRTARGGL
jgi:predicted alpha/beta hydrolase